MHYFNDVRIQLLGNDQWMFRFLSALSFLINNPAYLWGRLLRRWLISNTSATAEIGVEAPLNLWIKCNTLIFNQLKLCLASSPWIKTMTSEYRVINLLKNE